MDPTKGHDVCAGGSCEAAGAVESRGILESPEPASPVEPHESEPPTWGTEADKADIDDVANVWIHIYHMDPYTGWLNNWVGLKYAEMPIHHTGVEVYGEEWCFNYFEDCWDEDSISGVINCIPRQMPGYEYQESICLGPTQLLEHEVDNVLIRLREEWPANSYHITRRNCMHFARTYVGHLSPRDPWPEKAHGINDFTENNPITNGVVDYGWSWAKWYMRRKWATNGDQAANAASGSADAAQSAK